MRGSRAQCTVQGRERMGGSWRRKYSRKLHAHTAQGAKSVHRTMKFLQPPKTMRLAVSFMYCEPSSWSILPGRAACSRRTQERRHTTPRSRSTPHAHTEQETHYAHARQDQHKRQINDLDAATPVLCVALASSRAMLAKPEKMRASVQSSCLAQCLPDWLKQPTRLQRTSRRRCSR
jgi:hypothetical protein